MSGRFGAVVTAMVTPFRDDLSLDLDRAAELAEWLLDHGTDALVVAGSTGESATLTDREKAHLFRAVVEAAGGRGRVIAGTGTNDTAHTIHLTQEAERAGCDAVLLVAPYYNKPPQAGLDAHFRKVAESTSLPCMLYNIPGRTAVRIENQTMLRLAELDNVVGVKDATGDFQALSSLIGSAPTGFEVYCGDDWAAFPAACLGAVGVVSVTSHICGEDIAEMFRLLDKGDIPGARLVHQRLLPVSDVLFTTTNPIPVKAACALIGQPVGPPRLPLVPATDDQISKIRTVLAGAGIL